MMAKEISEVRKKGIEAVEKPVNAWRQNIAQADAIVPKPSRHYRAWLFQSYMIGAVAVVVVLAILAKTVAYFAFDVTITQALQTFHPGWFEALMTALSWIGFPPQAWIISVLVILFLFISGLKWETVVITLSLIGSSVLVILLKVLVERPRPAADLVTVLTQLKSYSFPSGHVVFFTTFTGFLIFLVYTLLKQSWGRTLLLVVLSILVVLIGPSRIYEGQHWASDVLAAYLIGSVWLSLSILIYRRGKSRYFVNQPVAKETPA
jgi:membrane-associated phospholipid phosphatase